MATSFDKADDRQEEIHQAVVRLPQRQREALELREIERLSYTEIAARMGTKHGSVTQLISRARINLYDELRGTPLASIAAPSAECERSLPLIAAREDGQLDPASDGDAAWLDAHLAGCERCRPAVEQMAEAAAAYRASAAPGAPADSPTAQPPAPGGARRRWRTAALVATSLAVVILAAALVGDGGESADPATDVAAPATSGGKGSPPASAADADGRKGDAKKKTKPTKGEAKAAAGQGATGEATAGKAAPTTVVDPAPPPAGGAPSEHTSGPNRASGKPAVNAPKQVSIPKPSSKPKPAPSSTQAPEPSPAPSPIEPPPEASPPTEEAPDKPGRSGEAPGKPADRPPR